MVIAPDRPSGEDFFEVFQKELVDQGIPVDLGIVFPVIPPRVTAEGELSSSPAIVQKLAAVFRDGYVEGYREMLIACNTLQWWIEEARGLLPEEYSDLTVYNSFAVLKAEYADPQTRPVWLGTTPTVNRVGRDFPTLLTLNRPELQELNQEIIWRVKAITGADYQNAPRSLRPDIASEDVLRRKVGEFLEKLGQLPNKRFITGCSELMMALVRYVEEDQRYLLNEIELIDPAVIMARNVI